MREKFEQFGIDVNVQSMTYGHLLELKEKMSDGFKLTIITEYENEDANTGEKMMPSSANGNCIGVTPPEYRLSDAEYNFINSCATEELVMEMIETSNALKKLEKKILKLRELLLRTKVNDGVSFHKI